MYLFSLVGFVLLVRSTASVITTSTEKSNIKTVTNNNEAQMHLLNKTKLSLVSEGGNILPNTSDISLPKEDTISLISVDEELSKTKAKPVVPRKGVDNFLGDIAVNKSSTQLHSDTSVTAATQKLNTVANGTQVSSTTKPTKSSSLANETPKESKQVITPVVPKKPLVLSYEGLVNIEKKIQNGTPKIPVASSTNSAASSQIPSPNEDSKKQVNISKVTSHPGLIMPIVITILVVPMFAIVGYLALKRGQEAWKNRHYKRMDFLLDGMYND